MEEDLNVAHGQMVQALAKDGADIIRDLTPFHAHLWHMASCIQGEAGELFDAIKKPVIYATGEFDMANVLEELGDIEFYLQGLRSALGITRDDTLRANMQKLSKRYASGSYSNEQAQARADKLERNFIGQHNEQA